jgi:phage shock protein A
VDDRLHMAIEVRAWLNDLRASDPARAGLTARALLALIDHGTGLGPPLLVEAAARVHDPAGSLDDAYERQLGLLTHVRRGIADVATSRKRLELHIQLLELQATKLADQGEKARGLGRQDLVRDVKARMSMVASQLAAIRGQYAGLRTEEEKLTAADQRLEAKVGAFRTRKETVKAGLSAARAGQAVTEALETVGVVDEADSATAEGAVPAAAAAADLLQSGRTVEREIAAAGGQPRTGREAGLGEQPALLELRPGVPGDYGIRVLLTFDPAGIPVVLAAGDGPDAAWLGLAFARAEERLRSLASGTPGSPGSPGTPGPVAERLVTPFTSYDRRSFLGEFCPADGAAAEAGAAALAAGNRAHRLAQVRRRSGLTVAQVAERMNVAPERVTQIERAEPGATEVGDLAAYVRALGGRLDVVADFGAEIVNLH